MEKEFEILKKEVMDMGAVLVGAADLKDVPGALLPVGVVALYPIPDHIVEQLKVLPTQEYYDAYHSINDELAKIAEHIESYLKGLGYNAIINNGDNLPMLPDDRSPLPHKTVACKAGLGWIGKNNLLITPEYGGAIRMAVVVTDAPLPTGTPIEKSKCGNCTKCVDACPSHALYGTSWVAGIPREEIFDRPLCEKTAEARSFEGYGKEYAICGLCFAVCPHAKINH